MENLNNLVSTIMKKKVVVPVEIARALIELYPEKCSQGFMIPVKPGVFLRVYIAIGDAIVEYFGDHYTEEEIERMSWEDFSIDEYPFIKNTLREVVREEFEGVEFQ